jgi:phage-related protein
MATVEELVVMARPEGLEDTTQGFEQMQDGLADTEEQMAETTDQFGDLQNKWTGALGAIVAGLGVAIGGLLTQIPVLGEVGAGFAAVAEAIAFQLDQKLRPALQPVTNGLFDLASAIFEADRTGRNLVSLLTALTASVVGATGALVPFLGVGGAVAAVFGKIATAVKLAAAPYAAFVSGSLAAAGALGALIGVAGVAALEVTGVLDAVREFGQYVGDQLPESITDGMLAVSSAFLGPLAVIGAGIKGFVSGFLEGGLEAGVDRAVRNIRQALSIFAGAWRRTFNRAKQLISDFVNGVVSGVSDVASGLQKIAGEVTDEFMNLVEQARQWGENLIENFIEGIKSKISELSGALDDVESEVRGTLDVNIGNLGGGGGGGNNQPRSVSLSGGGTSVFIDGRDITDETGRYREDQTARRNIF